MLLSCLQNTDSKEIRAQEIPYRTYFPGKDMKISANGMYVWHELYPSSKNSRKFPEILLYDLNIFEN